VPEIVGYCLIQESIDSVRLQYVESKPVPEDRMRWLVNEISKALGGDAHVLPEPTESLPKTRSGKYKYIRCEIADAM